MYSSTESEDSEDDISSSYSSDGQIPMESIKMYGSATEVQCIDNDAGDVIHVVSDSMSGKKMVLPKSFDSRETESDSSSSYKSEGEITCSSKQLYDSSFQGVNDDTQLGHLEADCSNWFLPVMSDEDKIYLKEFPSDGTHGDNRIYPQAVQYCLPRPLQDRLHYLTQIKGNVAYIKSPAMTIRVFKRDMPVPGTVICDVFLFHTSDPVMLLTFATETNTLTRQYNSLLAQRLNEVVREAGIRDFHLEHGVLQQTDWREMSQFCKHVQEMKTFAAATAMTRGLEMNKTKQALVLNTFVRKMVDQQKLENSYKETFTHFVETAAYQAARHQLQLTNVLILTGGPGEGKTTIGHRLCYDYHQQGYNTVFYSKQWDINWDVLEVSRPTLVVCDDVLGDYLIDVMDSVEKNRSNVKVVLIKRMQRKMMYFEDFPVIDVTDINKQHIDKTKETYMLMMETLTELSEHQRMIISSNLHTFVGYPKALKLYRKYRHNVDPITYFTYPLHFFIGEMERIAMQSDMVEWLYLLLCGGSFDYDDDKDDIVVVKVIQKLRPISDKRQFHMNLWRFMHAYIDVRQDTRRVYFCHPFIYDASLFVVDRMYPGFLWKNCEVVFQIEEQSYIRLPKFTVFISPQNEDMFLSQIAEDLKKGKFRQTLPHRLLRKQKNVEKLLKNLGPGLNNIAQTEEKTRSFLYWAVQSDNQLLLNALLENEGIMQTDANRALVDCFKQSDIESFIYLRQQLLNLKRQTVSFYDDFTDTNGNTLLMIAMKKQDRELVKFSTKYVQNVLLQNCDGSTALHIACNTGDKKFVEHVLPFSYMVDFKDLTLKDNEGNTVLHQVCQKENLELTKLLLSHMSDSKDVMLQNDDGNTALHKVCLNENTEMLKCHTRNYKNISQADNEGNTALHIACLKENTALVDILIRNMTDFDDYTLRNKQGNTALHIACLKENTKLAEVLLPHVRDMSVANNEGNTALHIACLKQNTKLAEVLLPHVRDMSVANNEGNTALHIACLKENRTLADLLIPHMTDFKDFILRNMQGNTALHIACLKENRAMVEHILPHFMKNKDLMLPNNCGNALLHLACLAGYKQIITRILSKSQYSKNQPGQYLRTPVMMAALKGHGQLYEYLADVEKSQLTGVDDNGDTILHLACVGGNLTIVKHLVTGCIIDRNLRGQYGKTPLMVSAYCQNKVVFDWLLEQKCNISSDDFSIKDMIYNGHIKCFTSIAVFLQSREHGTGKYLLESKKHGLHEKLEKHLERKGSNMLFEDESGLNLLHTAVNTGHLELADLLLSKGNIDINIRDGRGRTPLMLAAAAGHERMFDFLLSWKGDLSLEDEVSDGILHFACQGGNRVIIAKVIEQGFTDVNKRDANMKTPLSYAAEKGDKHGFNTVLHKSGDLSVIDRDKNTLLHLACKGGNLGIVEHLLSLGMFVIDAINIKHRTPLLVAAYNDHTDICQHLICVGADLHIHDWDGNDVLLVAADLGNKCLTEYILTKGKTTYCDKDIYKATSKAAERGNTEVYRLLMDLNGCGIEESDKNGNNILHTASIGGNMDIVQDIISRNILDINCRNSDGKTPVMWAAEMGHKRLFQVLVSKSECDQSVQDSFGYNILHSSCIGGSVDIVQYVLSQNMADINSKDGRGRTPVMKAAERGHSRVFDLLVDRGCDLSVEDRDGENILHSACVGGNEDIVQCVISQKDLTKKKDDSSRRTPIMLAAERGHFHVFDLLVSKKFSLIGIFQNGENLLHVACKGGSVHIVSYIISLRLVSVNSTDYSGMTPIMRAAEKGQREVIDSLVRKDCDLAAENKDGCNILHVACSAGSEEIVKYILTLNIVHIDSRDNQGRTPVMKAAENGHGAVIDLLVTKGCDLSVVDRNGDNILHVASTECSADIVEYILAEKIVHINSIDWKGKTSVMKVAEKGLSGMFQLLLRKGCDLSLVDRQGNNIIHLACIGGNLDIMKYVISQSIANINSRDLRGKTPLMMAAEKGHSKLFNLLVHAGCSFFVVDGGKRNILHLACIGGSVDIVQDVISKNVLDINSGDRQGMTPLMMAAVNGHRGVFDILVRKGSDLSTVDRNEDNILHAACVGGNDEIVQYILSQKKLDINSKNRWGRTPVMNAEEKGHRKVFDLLVSENCDHTVVDRYGDNMLHVACTGGSVHIVNFLLAMKIYHINSRGHKGKTPVMKAEENGHRQVFELLLCNGCDLTAVDRDKNNILHSACLGGCLEIVKHILSRNKFGVNCADITGRTPVMKAAEKGHRGVFDILVRKKCDLSTDDREGNNILHVACIGGSVDIVQYILSNDIADINSKNRRGRTPVMMAAEKGHTILIDLLMNKGCDLQVVDIDNENILHVASMGRSVGLLQYVLTLNVADINSINKEGRTPVMKAAEKRRRGVLELLVRKGCDLSVLDKEGNNILHVACHGGSADFVKYILSQNIVTINSLDGEGKTPAMKAAEMGRKQVFEFLVSKGCDLSVKDRDQVDILHAACIGGSVDIVQYIVSQNIVDINSTDWRGKTPVMKAAVKGHTEIFNFIVSKECDLTLEDKDGNNVLHEACIGGSVDIVQYIVSQNIVDINSTDWNGKTPVMKAAVKGHTEIFNFIVSKECDLTLEDKDGNNVLHEACIGGSVNIVKLILSQNRIDINKRNKDGSTPLSIAEKNNNLAVVELLRRRRGRE